MNYETLYNKAAAAGHAAAIAKVPDPMTITDGRTVWHVADGLCGFAWIKFKGNTAWAKWAKKAGHARHTGTIWVSAYNQSIARKEAYARAFAKVLNENGIEAFAESRLD